MEKGPSNRLYRLIRRYRDVYFEGFANLLVKLKISPNMISYFRLLLFLPIFWSIGVNLWITFWLVMIGFFLDAIDGLVARKTNAESKYGEFLDFLIDKLQLIPLVTGLVFYAYASWFWASLYLIEFLLALFLIYLKSKAFNYSRFLVYFAAFFYCIWSINLIDVSLVFLSFYQLVFLIKYFKDLYV